MTDVWITFNREDDVPVGVPLVVRLKGTIGMTEEHRTTTAVYEKRGNITAWWLPNGKPTGLYNVIAYRRQNARV